MPYFESLFFFTAPATTDIYTLSLHDALPISLLRVARRARSDGQANTMIAVENLHKRFGEVRAVDGVSFTAPDGKVTDRKSTRLNSSHSQISYAGFCLKNITASLTAATSQPTY